MCGDVGCTTVTCAQRSSLRPGCVVPAINAWRPHPPVRRTPCHFPAPPVIGTVFDIQGSHPVRPPHLPDFRCCTVQDYRLQLTPGAPMRALLSSFRTGTSHRVDSRNPWQLRLSRKSASCRNSISASSPFAFATVLLIACPTGLTRPAGLYVPADPLGLLLPGFQVAKVTPCSCRISLRGHTENCLGGTFTRKHSS